MTLTFNDPNEVKSAGKPGAPAQETQGKAAPTTRHNPVCLDVGVTIRSLPGEDGSLNRPFQEEARTVIVFDNGAVLRSSNKLPSGLKVILTNARGRDAVCKVAEGRNIPAVKGYIELEFTETVADFWQIHQDAAPVVSAPPLPVVPAPVEPTKAQPLGPPEVSSLAETVADAAKPVSQSSGSAPTFEDVIGLVRMPSPSKRALSAEPAKSVPSAPLSSGRTPQSHEAPRSLSPGAPGLVNSETAKKEPPKRVTSGLSLSTSQTQSPAADFMSKGLLTSAPAQSASGAWSRLVTPVLAVLVLAGAAAGFYFWQKGGVSIPDFKAVFGMKAASTPPVASIAAPAPVQSPQQVESPKSDFAPSATEENSQQPTPLDATPVARQERLGGDVRDAHKQIKIQAPPKRTDSTPSRSQAIPSLSMQSPTTRVKILPNPSLEAAPVTDVTSMGAVNGAPPAGLISATARLSAAPAPAPAFPAVTTPPPAKISTAAKLISSTRPVYPPSARESNIQGSVTVQASVDEKGNVIAAKALSGPVFLRQAAVDSVKQWKYSPAMLDGKPALSEVTVNIEFRLK